MSKPDKPITDADVEKFMIELADHARGDIIPKMRQSVFCVTVIDASGPDPYMALQVGLALLLEKPLIILGVEGAWIPERLRKLADAVVIGPSPRDPETVEKMQKAFGDVVRKMGRRQ